MRIFLIISLWVLISTVNTEAQEYWKISGKSISELRKDTLLAEYQRPAIAYSSRVRLTARPQDQVIPRDITKVKVPSAYSYDHLGMFCKWEVQIERAVGLPVKFRLGEVQYVERLEGKW